MKAISCKQAVEFILRKEEGTLTFMQRIHLWRHLAICSLCKLFLSQNKVINTELKRHREKQFILSDKEKERIIQNVLDDQQKH